MDELADQVSAYYEALMARNIPDEFARHLVLDWQASMLNHAHFVIMERNMGMRQYAQYYTRVVQNYITKVMNAPTFTTNQIVDAVARQIRGRR